MTNELYISRTKKAHSSHESSHEHPALVGEQQEDRQTGRSITQELSNPNFPVFLIRRSPDQRKKRAMCFHTWL